MTSNICWPDGEDEEDGVKGNCPWQLSANNMPDRLSQTRSQQTQANMYGFGVKLYTHYLWKIIVDLQLVEINYVAGGFQS